MVGTFALMGCTGSTSLHGKALEQSQYRGYGESQPERDSESLTQAAAVKDAASVIYLLTPAHDSSQAQAVEAVILKLDPRACAKLRPDDATGKGSSAAPGLEQL
uniref:hypothetical protein n=1 Tax=Corallococcus coralloides TaxID=184914 RepID=UPI000FFEA421|nr:hypothetical protein [Corallococcus coralloides]